jgi:uncharacterized membrane protein
MSKTPNTESKSAALRLITIRGEGLTKILAATPRAADINDESIFKKSDAKWDFHFRQILNPTEERPKRRTFPDPVYAFDPLEQKETTPQQLLDEQSELGQISTTMTSTSLLPRDSKMTLFGTRETAGCGVLYDLRLCDLKNEKFVFDEDALTDNDWFFNPDSGGKLTFRSQTINDLRTNTQLEDISERLREYNEILAGLNAKAMSAILLQPPTEGIESKEQHFISRFYAISRTLYVADHINRHLPITILDANQGAYEYTFEQQQAELQQYIKEYPDNKNFQYLFDKNKALNDYAPVENESNELPQITSTNLDIITRRRQLITEKMVLVDEKIQLLSDILALENQFANIDNESDPALQALNTKKNSLVELYLTNIEALAFIDGKLDDPERKLTDSPRSQHFLQFQEDLAADKHRRSPELVIREPEPQAVIPDTTFWQRNKSKIIGAIIGLLIAAVVITVSVFTFGIVPLVGALGVIGLACAGVGLGVLGFGIGATVDKITDRKQEKISSEHLRENLLVKSSSLHPVNKPLKKIKKKVSFAPDLVDKSPNSYKPIFSSESKSIQAGGKKDTPAPGGNSRPRKN